MRPQQEKKRFFLIMFVVGEPGENSYAGSLQATFQSV